MRDDLDLPAPTFTRYRVALWLLVLFGCSVLAAGILDAMPHGLLVATAFVLLAWAILVTCWALRLHEDCREVLIVLDQVEGKLLEAEANVREAERAWAEES